MAFVFILQDKRTNIFFFYVICFYSFSSKKEFNDIFILLFTLSCSFFDFFDYEAIVVQKSLKLNADDSNFVNLVYTFSNSVEMARKEKQCFYSNHKITYS